MTTINVAVVTPDAEPWPYAVVTVRLIDAGSGGAVEEAVVTGISTIRCDADGEGSITLTPNEDISPAGTFYAFAVENSSPSTVRCIEVPDSGTALSWADPTIQVLVDDPPVFIPAPSLANALKVVRVNSSGDAYELSAASSGGGTVDVVSNVATSTILGRTTSGTGDSEELTPSAVRTLLALVPGTNVPTGTGSATGTNTGDQDLSALAPKASPTFTGTVSGITAAMVGAPSGSGTSSGTNTGDQTLPTLASLGAVPTSRTLAGLDLSADRTASALRTALGLVIGTDVLAPNGSGAGLTGLDTTKDYYRGTGYHFPNGRVGSNMSITRDTTIMFPFRISNTKTAIGISLYISTGGGTGSLTRLGIYNSDATTGQPTTLLVDGGTVASSSTGALEATISQSLTPGVYWIAANPTGGTGDPSAGALDASGDPLIIDTSHGVNQAGAYQDVTANSASGALPATFTISNRRAALTPRLGVRF